MFDGYGIMPSELLPSSEEKIVVTREKKVKEPYPGYTIFGNGKETKNGGKSMDILDVCKQLNTAEMNLMQFFRDEIEKSKMSGEFNPNVVRVARSECWSEYLKVALKKNYKHMRDMGIVKRMYKGTYLLNPMLFVPVKNVEKIKEEWESCGE